MFLSKQVLEDEMEHDPFKGMFDDPVIPEFGQALQNLDNSGDLPLEVFSPKTIEQEESMVCTEQVTDKQSKRMNSRMRSRKARQRKKKYLKELELRVKYLEKENIRLQNLVNLKKLEEAKDMSLDSRAFTCDFEQQVREVWSNIIDLDTLDKRDENPPISEMYDDSFMKILEKHKVFIDSVTRMLVNNIHCNATPLYWKDLSEKKYTTDYSIIKKLNSLTKYQTPEFMETHKLQEIDLFVASLNPNKTQFNFLKNIYFKKESEIKTKCLQAIKKVLDAKSLIQESYVENHLLIGLLAKSGIFTDDQIINSKMKETILRKDRNYQDIWRVKSVPYTVRYKLSRDKTIGRAVRKYLPKEDYNKDIEFSRFYVDVA
ncbi:unnamed protein product [Moneuplotes crassus]|uniref:BZIP domain-containing protein n=1 Tax=Euplotes crassus TaxID=5936 RepID=A0AAD1UMF1_EUPCR|nr:unnamed protein product [Moneuplotes crassus]